VTVLSPENGSRRKCVGVDRLEIKHEFYSTIEFNALGSKGIYFSLLFSENFEFD
jgi:hypothetical protein